MRLVVLNDGLYKIKEKDFKIIIEDGSISHHQVNCDFVRNYYKPIKTIDLILRDD